MKKLLTFLTLLTLSIGVGLAETAILPGTQALTTTATYVGTDTHIKIKTSSANTYTNPLRIYANTTVTITADQGYVLKSVTYEASSTGDYVTNAQNAAVTPNVTPTVSGKNVTWTFTTDPTEFTFKPSAQTRCSSISISYEASGSTPACATPSFNPEPGNTLYESQDVTISTTTPDATIYYTTDGNDPDNTSAEYTGPITISTTTTIKAIAYADDHDPSDVASATYIFGEPASNGLATFDATIDKGTSPLIKSPITFACSNGVLNNGTEYRLYKNSTTTFSVEDGYTITKIEFVGTESNPVSGFGTTSGLTTDGNDGTWIGEAQSVEFTASEAQVRATLINIYFEENSSITVGAPSISFDEWTSGDITVNASITPGNNATATLYKIGEDGIYATYTDPIEIDLTEEASPITVYAKSTNGDNESKEVSATFTLPTLTVSINPPSYSGTEVQSVEISATNIVGRAALTYKINDGNVENYSDAISLSTPGTYTITAYATDDRADGEQVSATATITITEQPSGETQIATFVAGTDKGTSSSDGSPDSMSKGDPLVTIYCTDAAFATAQYRFYGNSITTVSVPAGSTITKIEFIGNDDSRPVSRFSLANGSNGTFSVSSNTGTWIGESNSVSFDASAQVRCSGVNVTYIAGETPPTPTAAEYYVVGDLSGNEWPAIDAYKFTADPEHEGIYVLNTTIPDMNNDDYVHFKIAKIENGVRTEYSSNWDGGYPIYRGHNTDIPMSASDNKIYYMPDSYNAVFTLDINNMTFSVDKPMLLRESSDGNNWTDYEMEDNANGGWTITKNVAADTYFHLYNGWHEHRGTSESSDAYWVNPINQVRGLVQNGPNFKMVTAGEYTLSVNSDLSQLTIVPPTFQAKIASGITGGSVSFNASNQQNTLNIYSGTTVIVYVSPNNADWELATLTYTVEGGQPVDINETEGQYSFTMPAANVDINATFNYIGTATFTTYERLTNLNDLVVGQKYLIVNEANSVALSGNSSSNNKKDITINDNHQTTISSDSGIAEFELCSSGNNTYPYRFKHGDLYLSNSDGSQLLDQYNSDNSNTYWDVSLDNGFTKILSTHNRIVYYFASNGGDFRCYSANNYHSNVYIYKVVTPATELTLAEIIALGDEADGKLYKIINEDGLLGVYKNGTSVWFKDKNGEAVDIQVPGANDKFYVVDEGNNVTTSEKDFDQSNWIEVVLLEDREEVNYVSAYVKNLTGTYSWQNGNPKLTLTVAVADNDVNSLTDPADEYTPNPYMAANFLGSQEYTNSQGVTSTYFFPMPKAQEYAKILWAVWDGEKMNMPTVGNVYGFQGSFTLNDEFCSLGALISGNSYDFEGVIRKVAAPEGSKAAGDNYEVSPIRISDTPTAISTVGINGNVKSVKYVNVAGIVSDRPFQGVNIVVTEYTDGSRTTTKMLRK